MLQGLVMRSRDHAGKVALLVLSNVSVCEWEIFKRAFTGTLSNRHALVARKSSVTRRNASLLIQLLTACFCLSLSSMVLFQSPCKARILNNDKTIALCLAVFHHCWINSCQWGWIPLSGLTEVTWYTGPGAVFTAAAEWAEGRKASLCAAGQERTGLTNTLLTS